MHSQTCFQTLTYSQNDFYVTLEAFKKLSLVTLELYRGSVVYVMRM